MNTIKCSHCGYENSEYETYCLKCGRVLGKTPQKPPTPPTHPTTTTPPTPPISMSYKIAVIVLTFIIIVQVIVLMILRNNNSSSSAIQPTGYVAVFVHSTQSEETAPRDETLFSSCCRKDELT